MNQLHDAEASNIVPEQRDVGAIGGEPLPPPPPVGASIRQDPANVNIVNEYNSFNLANVTPPIAPKWKTSETLLDDFHKFNGHVREYLMDQCVTLHLVRSKPACYLSVQDQMERIFMKISTSCLTRSMMLTMCLGGLMNFVNQFATFIWQDSSSLKCTNTMVSLLMFSTTESSRLPDSVSSQIWMIELLVPLYLVLTVLKPRTNCSRLLRDPFCNNVFLWCVTMNC